VKILVRATNWVGDAIMALPALRAVRNKFADAQIAIVARPYVADIYRGQGVCDELIAYDPRGAEKGIAGRERLAARLRADKFDAALLLQNAFDGAWLVWRAGIPERIGYARDGRGILLTKSIAVPKAGEIPEHEQFYYLELVRRAGWVERITGETEISLAVSRESGELAEGRLIAAGVRSRADDGRPLRVAIGAGASYGSAKCWLPERFAEVANRLMNESNAEIILFGTAGETAVSDAFAMPTFHRK
jgi:heptosyltransferase II